MSGRDGVLFRKNADMDYKTFYAPKDLYARGMCVKSKRTKYLGVLLEFFSDGNSIIGVSYVRSAGCGESVVWKPYVSRLQILELPAGPPVLDSPTVDYQDEIKNKVITPCAREVAAELGFYVYDPENGRKVEDLEQVKQIFSNEFYEVSQSILIQVSGWTEEKRESFYMVMLKLCISAVQE